MTAFLNGRQFSDAGQLQALDGSGGVPAGSFFYEGWAMSGDGEPYVEDLEANAVPAGAHFISGIAFNEDGCMYVTTDAPSSARFISGLAVRNDGALHVDTDAVDAADTFPAGMGWAVAQTGAARVAIS